MRVARVMFFHAGTNTPISWEVAVPDDTLFATVSIDEPETTAFSHKMVQTRFTFMDEDSCELNDY